MKKRVIFFLVIVNFVSLLFPENNNETNYIKECVNNFYYKDNYKNWKSCDYIFIRKAGETGLKYGY